MLGGSRGSVRDLVAAAGAGGSDDVVWAGGADRRQQHYFGDLHRHRVMLLLVAEGAGHAAAITGDFANSIIARQAEDAQHRRTRGQRLLVAVDMHQDRPCCVGEGIGADPAGIHLPHDELPRTSGCDPPVSGRCHAAAARQGRDTRP
jgi:hypothetical protein